MAKIQNTQLSIGQGSTSSKAKVTVTSAIEFTPADTGSWKVAIGLYGDDTGEGGGQTLIYTFKFGGPFFKKDYKSIQGNPGTVSISESREIDWNLTDEDPGTRPPNNAPPGTPGVPFKDEVFARLTLSRDAKSNVWESFGA